MALVSDRVRLSDAVGDPDRNETAALSHVDRRHFERQPFFNRLRNPGVIGAQHQFRIWQFQAKGCGRVGRSGRLPMLISLFRHADEQYSTRRVGEHADIQKELAPASIIILIQGALVFELQMFFKAGFNQPASISVANVPERPSFPQHAVIVKSLPNVSKSRLGDAVPQFPSVVAEAIFDELQNTFAPSRHLVVQGAWKSDTPGGRLLSYLVAGYTKNFKRPYVFELGVEINPANDDLRFVAPFRRDARPPQTVLIGEDKFIQRANAGYQPEQSARDEIISTVFPEILRDFPTATEALKIRLASVAASIKVEARFNPTRVGSRVFVALTERHQRASLAASY